MRSAAVSIAPSLAGILLVLAIAGASRPAYAQSADLVLCDRVAADPTDPDRPTNIPGVAQIAPSDIPIAVKYCRAAAASSRRALYQLGRAYAAERQLAEAVTVWRKAADKGSTAAMVELGLLYLSGSGVTKDQEQARTLLLRAAESGNAHAAAELAALATNNGGTPSDPVEARALLEKAAATNSADAEFQLGWMLATGLGGPKDDVGARSLFEKAAAQNHPEALDWMGNFAESGRGGATDKEAAKSYYQRAAALGNEDAKAALKRMDCPLVVKDKRGKFVSYVCF